MTGWRHPRSVRPFGNAPAPAERSPCPRGGRQWAARCHARAFEGTAHLSAWRTAGGTTGRARVRPPIAGHSYGPRGLALKFRGAPPICTRHAGGHRRVAYEMGAPPAPRAGAVRRAAVGHRLSLGHGGSRPRDLNGPRTPVGNRRAVWGSSLGVPGLPASSAPWAGPALVRPPFGGGPGGDRLPVRLAADPDRRGAGRQGGPSHLPACPLKSSGRDTLGFARKWAIRTGQQPS